MEIISKKQLGIKIQAKRNNVGISQGELAERCNVSGRTISNLERGEAVPSLQLLYSVAKEFNASIDDLLNNNISSTKSLARQKQENKLIEEIQNADDTVLNHFEEYLRFLKNYYNQQHI